MEETKNKYLGAMVQENIYNKFKATAAMRGESMQEAIKNAALMYLEVHVNTREDLDRRLG